MTKCSLNKTLLVVCCFCLLSVSNFVLQSARAKSDVRSVSVQTNLSVDNLKRILTNIVPITADLLEVISGDEFAISCVRQSPISHVCSTGVGKAAFRQSSIGEGNIQLLVKDISTEREGKISIFLDASNGQQRKIRFEWDHNASSLAVLEQTALFENLKKFYDEILLSHPSLIVSVADKNRYQDITEILNAQVLDLGNEVRETKGFLATDFRKSYFFGFILICAVISFILGFTVGMLRRR